MLLGKFICRLAVLNRLTTEARQVHLGRSLDPTCMFCNARPKDVGHIFFTCQFTKHLWNAFSRNEAFTDRLTITAMARVARACLRSILKIVNSTLGLVGIAMILYGFWMLRVLQRDMESPSFDDFDSTALW
ncbi:hypothetical protein NC651_026490 [Populus alba x Populus x berolinensis]|nr:hypothetical protein NC651_026490 [Populus alba x Populus x berolinensis]